MYTLSDIHDPSLHLILTGGGGGGEKEKERKRESVVPSLHNIHVHVTCGYVVYVVYVCNLACGYVHLLRILNSSGS